MKKLGIFLTISALMTGIFAVLQRHENAELKTNAATPQTHRRVYAFITGDWDNRDGDDNRMFIHYWGGSSGSKWDSKPEMTRVLSDYWRGLFYYDIPVDATDVLFAAFDGDVGKNSNQTVNVAISNLFPSGSFRAAKIGSWVADGDKRSVSFETGIGMSTEQFGAVLGHLDTCSPNYAYGFNSYPQINELITTKSTIDRSAKVTNGPKESNAPTIGEKLDAMQVRYNADQNPAESLNPSTRDLNLNGTVVISIIGAATLLGYYFLTRKKIIA